MKKQTGISLLEIVLVLAIIASIMLASMRFFTIASENAKVNNAISMIREVTDASYKWYQMDHNNFNNITFEELTKLKLLPEKYNDPNDPTKVEAINPWGGAIEIGAGDNDKVRITLTTVPHKDYSPEAEEQTNKACEKLVHQLAEFNSEKLSKCSDGEFISDF